MRFLRLAYLLDFVAVDSLGKMIMSSLQNFMDMLYGGKIDTGEIRKHGDSDGFSDNSLVLPAGLVLGLTAGSEDKNAFVDNNPNYKPILQLSLNYNEGVDLQYKKKTVEFGQIQKSFMNFDLSGFLIFEEAKGYTYEEDSPLSCREVNNICGSVLDIYPNEDVINSNMIECVTETLDALQII